MRNELLRINHMSLDHRPVRLNLTVYEREILVVCGLSDSGLFSLADILSGTTPMAEGSLWVCEQRPHPQWLRNSSENWIFSFQKKAAVLEHLTVAENIFVISGKKKSKVLIDYEEINFLAEEILKEFGLDISPKTTLGELREAEIYIIELIRAAYFGARLIILDNVFDGFSDSDRAFAYQAIKRLQDVGSSFLIFSSEHEELSSILDRLIIIRDGENIKSISSKDYDKDTIYHYMLGGSIYPAVYPLNAPQAQECTSPAFSALHISGNNLHNITFSAYPGEIFALLDYHDIYLQNFLDMLLQGQSYKGGFLILGEKIKNNQRNPLAAMGLGVVDYKDNSTLFETLSWPENLALMYRNRMGRHTPLSITKCAHFLAQEYRELLEDLPTDIPLNRLSITPYQQATLKYLGWIVRKPSVLICVRPYATADVIMRGVVDHMLQMVTSKGICVIVASTNPKEVASYSHRIGCIEDGSISEIVSSGTYIF